MKDIFEKKPKKVPITHLNENFRGKLFFQKIFLFFYVEKCRKMWEKVENFLKDIFEKNLKKCLLRGKMKIFAKYFFSQIFFLFFYVEKCRKM